MHVKWRFLIALVSILLMLVVPVTTAYAHGARIEYTVDMAIEIVASYDNGEPMAGAQVVVYAPDNPSSHWLTGVCDDEGRFSFVPDTSIQGTWDVQVRQAGHGDMVHIPIGEGKSPQDGASGNTVLQIVLTSACVIWGFIGTALFFMRRRA